MEVESWGRPYLDSYCTGYDVVNIEKVTIGTYWWSHYEDHAKWGTSKD